MVAVPDPHPNLDSVRQPGVTEFQAPPNFKARIKESYDAQGDKYNNKWTTEKNVHLRKQYAKSLIKLLKDDASKDKRNAAMARAMASGEQPVTWPFVLSDDGAVIPTLWGMHALEVGCGGGTPVLEMLLGETIDTIGVDISARQIDEARRKFPKETKSLQAVWAEQDMMDLRFPPAEFNMVVALFSLLHLERDEQTVFLHRAHRWLKPGGMLLFNFPQEEGEGKICDQWHGKETGWLFVSSWGQDKMMRVVRRLGFEVMEETVWGDGGLEEPNVVWVIAKKPDNQSLAPVREFVQRPRQISVVEPTQETPMTALANMDSQ